MKKNLDHLITSAIDWAFRRREPGLTLVRVGCYVLLALAAGVFFSIKFPTPWGQAEFTYSTENNPLSWLSWAILSLAGVVIIVGLKVTWRSLQRKRAIAIEVRGLRDTSGDPLYEKIPVNVPGLRDQILINLRQGADGLLIAPDLALQRICSLPAQIQNLEQGRDRSDIRYVAGALAPVPYSFLAGVLLDDEGRIEVMDWDRKQECWRRLSERDDDRRFHVEGADAIGDAHEIVLAVSVSYATDGIAIAKTFPGLPVVKMNLEGASVDAHWSSEKQTALAAQFLDVAVALRSTSVRRVHLILAAPNSIAISFGRRYDKRNLPEIVVYQYEMGKIPPFPWGVLMPVAGIVSPSIVQN